MKSCLSVVSFSLGLFSFFVVCQCSNAAPGDDDGVIHLKISDCVKAIRNDDVKWDGTPLGVWPFTEGITGLLEKHGTKRCIPLLIKALENKEQYVAAHVLLVRISGAKHVVTGESWGGLHVDIQADAPVRIPASDQAVVIKKWKAWIDKQKRGIEKSAGGVKCTAKPAVQQRDKRGGGRESAGINRLGIENERESSKQRFQANKGSRNQKRVRHE